MLPLFKSFRGLFWDEVGSRYGGSNAAEGVGKVASLAEQCGRREKYKGKRGEGSGGGYKV